MQNNDGYTDEEMRQGMREILAIGEDIIATAKRYAQGDENAYLTAISDALRCDRHWCTCGGIRVGHEPVFTTYRTCQVAGCPCGGHYLPHSEAIISILAAADGDAPDAEDGRNA